MTSVDIFWAILASVFVNSTDCWPKCVSMGLDSFVSRPEGPWEPCFVMAAFLFFWAFVWSNVDEWKGIVSLEHDVI